MDTKNALIQLWDSKLIAIFRGVPKTEAGPVARALAEGGIRFFEIFQLLSGGNQNNCEDGSSIYLQSGMRGR